MVIAKGKRSGKIGNVLLPNKTGTILGPNIPNTTVPINVKKNVAENIARNVLEEDLFFPSFLLTIGVINWVAKVPRKQTILPMSDNKPYLPASEGDKKCFARTMSRLKKLIAERPVSREAK